MSNQIFSSGTAIAHLLRKEVDQVSALPGIIRRAGLDGLELPCAFLDSAWKEDLSSYPGLPADPAAVSGIIPASLHSSYIDFNLASYNPHIRNASISQLLVETEIARQSGFAPLTIHPGWEKKIDHKTALTYFWNSLSRVFEANKTNAKLICLENMDGKPGKLCSEEDDIAATIERFPDLGLTIDIAHLGLRGSDIGAFLDRFGRNIRHAHVSGVIPGVAHAKVSLRASHMDLRPYLERIADYDIAMVIENNTYDTMMESREVLESSLR